jgi:hypothetical protein
VGSKYQQIKKKTILGKKKTGLNTSFHIYHTYVQYPADNNWRPAWTAQQAAQQATQQATQQAHRNWRKRGGKF